MALPIRFGKGGPVPSIKVDKLSDLDSLQGQIDYEFSEGLSSLDDLTKGDKETSHKSYFEENTKRLREHQDHVADMMALFSRAVSNCDISEDLKGEDREKASEMILNLQEHSENLKTISSRKIALAHAKILTKALWNDRAMIQFPITEENRPQIEAFFKQGLFTKTAREFQTVLKEINLSLESTKGLTGKDLYDSMLCKGELYKVKEELITAFIEYKRTASVRYAELVDKRTSTSFICPLLTKQFTEKMQAIKGEKDLVDHVSAMVTSKRYNTPVSLLQDSLAIAILKAPKKNALAIHDLSISSSSIALGFALPVSLVNTIQLIRDRARRRKLVKGIHESKDIQAMGELMYREGQNVRQITQGLLSEKINDQSNLESLGTLFKQADSLMSLGIELKEKAHITEQELEKEVASMTFSIFNSSISTPLGLAGLASTSMQIASDFMKSPALSTGIQVMHSVGMASGGIGLILGTVNLIKKSQLIYETRNRIAELGKRMDALSSLEEDHKTDPLIKTFCNMEKSKLLAEKDALIADLRNYWIEIANSILLTIGGAIAFATFFTSAVVSGGITIAVFAILSVSTVIVIAHWKKKKSWKVEKVPIDTKLLDEKEGNYLPIANYLKYDKDRMEKYKDSPMTMLRQHFT